MAKPICEASRVPGLSAELNEAPGYGASMGKTWGRAASCQEGGGGRKPFLTQAAARAKLADPRHDSAGKPPNSRNLEVITAVGFRLSVAQET